MSQEQRPILAAYADGGVCQINPSPYGGTWAFCFTDTTSLIVPDPEPHLIRAQSGSFVPGRYGLELVTNNVTEFAALARALAALPDRWSGPIYSDSQVTLGRLFWGWTGNGLPEGWLELGRAHVGRLGDVQPILLDGHPTKRQLGAGLGKRGNLISTFNCWCDRRCAEEARKLKSSLLADDERRELERTAA